MLRLTLMALMQTSLPPPPATYDPFFLFFASGSAQIDASNRQIIRNCAKAYLVTQAEKIEVGGHADRQGDAVLNFALSKQRAEAVRQALIDQGVAARAISIAAHGEDQPLQKTRDGVAERYNRVATMMVR